MRANEIRKRNEDGNNCIDWGLVVGWFEGKERRGKTVIQKMREIFLM